MKRSFDEIDDDEMYDEDLPVKKIDSHHDNNKSKKKLFDECIDIILPNINLKIITDQIRYQILNHVNIHKNLFIYEILINVTDNYKKILLNNKEIVINFIYNFLMDEGFSNICSVNITNFSHILKICLTWNKTSIYDYYS